MSYSYLQAVFPKFEHSKVYDDKIYSSLDSIQSDIRNNKEKPVKKEIQSINELPKNNETSFKQLEMFGTDQEKNTQEMNHDIYIKHVLQCNYCKELMKKQFQFENDRLFKEELIELVSFIAFGIFLLMFLERSKK